MPDIKNILLPIDFSENSSKVFKYVRKLATEHQAKVDLIHVIPKMTYLDLVENVLGNPFKIQNKFEELKVELSKRMEAYLEENFEEAYRGEVIISNDARVSNGIMEQEKVKDYQLIVIGSRENHNSLTARGSVTERLVRMANTPVLSFQKEFDEKLEHILLPTDGSKVSYEALELALDFAERNGASLKIFSVLEFDFDRVKLLGGDPKFSEYAIQSQRQEIIENLSREIERSTEYSFVRMPTLRGATIIRKGKGAIKVEIIIVQNISAHQAIVKYADENAQLVVMTTHGRSGIAKLLIGSVAEKVVRYLNIPVLTITPEFAKK